EAPCVRWPVPRLRSISGIAIGWISVPVRRRRIGGRITPIAVARVAVTGVAVVTPIAGRRWRARGTADQPDPPADRRSERGSRPATGRRPDRRPRGGAEQSATERILRRVVGVGAGREREGKQGNQTTTNTLHFRPLGVLQAAFCTLWPARPSRSTQRD